MLQLWICQPVRTWVRPGHRPAQAKDRKQVALLRPRQGGVLGGLCLGVGRPAGWKQGRGGALLRPTLGGGWGSMLNAEFGYAI